MPSNQMNVALAETLEVPGASRRSRHRRRRTAYRRRTGRTRSRREPGKPWHPGPAIGFVAGVALALATVLALQLAS